MRFSAIQECSPVVANDWLKWLTKQHRHLSRTFFVSDHDVYNIVDRCGWKNLAGSRPNPQFFGLGINLKWNVDSGDLPNHVVFPILRSGLVTMLCIWNCTSKLTKTYLFIFVTGHISIIMWLLVTFTKKVGNVTMSCFCHIQQIYTNRFPSVILQFSFHRFLNRGNRQKPVWNPETQSLGDLCPIFRKPLGERGTETYGT